MKFVAYLLCLFISISHLASAKRDKAPRSTIPPKMVKVAEKYAKILIKEIPEKADGKSKSKARAAIVARLRQQGILTVNEDTQKKLKHRKDVVDTKRLATIIEHLKDDKDKETQLLIKLTKAKRLKSETKLLLFRLLQTRDQMLARQKQADDRAEAEAKRDMLAKIYQHFQQKRDSLKRIPADAKELDLPAELTKIDGHEWIYLGTRLNFGSQSGRIIVISPNKDSQGAHTALTLQGNVIRIKGDNIIAQWNKIKDQPTKTTPSPSPTVKPAENKNNLSYAKTVQHKFIQAFKLIAQKRNETNKWPANLTEAGIPENLQTIPSPDGSEKKKWIYLYGKKTASLKNLGVVIFLSPYPTRQSYFVGLHNGKIIRVSPKIYQQIITKINQPPKPKPKKEEPKSIHIEIE